MPLLPPYRFVVKGADTVNWKSSGAEQVEIGSLNDFNKFCDGRIARERLTLEQLTLNFRADYFPPNLFAAISNEITKQNSNVSILALYQGSWPEIPVPYGILCALNAFLKGKGPCKPDNKDLTFKAVADYFKLRETAIDIISHCGMQVLVKTHPNIVEYDRIEKERLEAEEALKKKRQENQKSDPPWATPSPSSPNGLTMSDIVSAMASPSFRIITEEESRR